MFVLKDFNKQVKWIPKVNDNKSNVKEKKKKKKVLCKWNF